MRMLPKHAGWLRRIPTRWWSLVSAAAVMVVFAIALGLSGCQEGLIYYPRPYPPQAALEDGLQAVRYHTDQGIQVSYLRPPHGQLHRLWIFFGGNGGLARGWSGVLNSWPRDDALLLIEYPGFGSCEGAPSPAHILSATVAAIDASAVLLQVRREAMCQDYGVLGHSLGCATALQCADAVPGCGHIALFAPFTTLRDMARLHVGWPLCYLLLHNFDNGARLQDLSRRRPVPTIGIASGDQDEVIPWSMGKRLSAIVRGTHFWLLPGHNHLSILEAIDDVLPVVGR
jgi:pimeloyl-ACP methyl ester carboxylesterase